MPKIEDFFSPGQRVFVGGASNEPSGLIEHLGKLALPSDLHFVQFPLPGYNAVDFTAWHPSYHLTTFFMTSALRDADPARLHYLPMQMRWIYDYLGSAIDVALLQVAPDRDGRLRMGPNVDFVDAVLAGAKVVIAEVNRSAIAPAGAPLVAEGQVDYWFETQRPLVEPSAPVIDATAAQIGSHVASLIVNGDCLQTGIGAIPAAILAALRDKEDLGMHGGLIDDGGMDLIARGNLNGARKPVDTGVHITGMALGSSALMQWLAERGDVAFRGANYTHDLSVIRGLPNFVSINSAVEIDLFGQVNAEYAGGRQISGTGGSVDFMRAAKASPGGRSIVAMHATARGGSVSRIVQKVDLVTALRTDVDIVVTEYGIAHLKDLPHDERATALIAVAAPEFREALADSNTV